MKNFRKKDFPVSDMRRLIEPGPIVLVSSHWKGKNNIMTMGWHMGMEFTMIGCFIWDQNHSVRDDPQKQGMRDQRSDLRHHPQGDRDREFHRRRDRQVRGIRAHAGEGGKVKAPLIRECYANFECRLVDTSLIRKYSLFVFEVVKAHAAVSPRFPRTIHYRGEGRFMVSGKEVDYARYFKPEML